MTQIIVCFDWSGEGVNGYADEVQFFKSPMLSENVCLAG